MAKKRKRAIRRRGKYKKRSAFTPRVRRLLYAAIKADLPYKRACEICGVNMKTFESWMKEGKKQDPLNPYYQFRSYIRRIEARKEVELLAIIDKVAKGDYKIRETEISFSDKGRSWKRKTKVMNPQWKAAAWRLERKYKEDYAPLQPQDQKDKSPEEIAEGIYQATQALRNSVPMAEEA